MSEAGGENLAPKVGMAAGALAALLILRRLRKRRKAKQFHPSRRPLRSRAPNRQLRPLEMVFLNWFIRVYHELAI
jgi:hypothetical protein